MPVYIIDKNQQRARKKPVQIDPRSKQYYPDGRMDGTQATKNLLTTSLQEYEDSKGLATAQILEKKEIETSWLDDLGGFFGYDTKSAKQARLQARYKCRVLSGADCYPVPQPKSGKDNISEIAPMYFVLPSDRSVDAQDLKIGSTVLVRIDNRATSFVNGVAGTIESIVNVNATIEQFSANCDFNLPKQKGKAKTTLLKECGIAVGGGSPRKVKRASAVPLRPTKSTAVSPTHPLTGGKTTKRSDLGVINSGYPFRNDGVTPHKGLDFKSPMGSPICAALDGIAMLGQDSRDPAKQGYGYYVVIKHVDYKTSTTDNTFYTLYAHMEQAGRVSGKVSAGQSIGASSDTGSPGSPHLHFEVIYDHNPAWKTANQVTQGGATDPIANFFLNKFEKK